MSVDYQTVSIVIAGISVSVAAIYYVLTLRATQRNTRELREEAGSTDMGYLSKNVVSRISENI